MTDLTVTEAAAGATALKRRRPAARTRRRHRGLNGRSLAVLVFLTMCALFFCVPLYVVLTTSLKTMEEIRQGQIFALPDTWTLEAWRFAWNEACSGITCEGLKVGFWNSVRILVPSLILSISLAMVTGYALALWEVKWAGTFLFLLFLCAFVPLQIIMFPLIAITRSMGVYGTILGVAVVHAVMSMPVLTLIFRNYYKDIPAEIMNAAIMDSGSFWRIFGEIILPMSGNILIVVLILQITNVWNDYLIGVTFGGYNTQPMTVNLANMVTVSTGTASYNVDMAAALLTAIPPLVVYFLVGKFFVAGITAGAIKG
ncbi:permease of ABC sugar transporter [Oceanicola granulosus HTCC2516]|uniref:Permease of ABC sugar transporter n=1 Tax=Oceanicola granulosus (strain ATCC BAA-861 / DSM 15982 / KCTC 12143 / HTCC2516) TaxID=314256 RepID=Q2CAM1_OCEGH|nr:carbohydrate ABC transporter permease [Oceanicola granulosus]EAR49731.1 permease of ABC sugar transporter [Oceanicola granulosus HTCC2516]